MKTKNHPRLRPGTSTGRLWYSLLLFHFSGGNLCPWPDTPYPRLSVSSLCVRRQLTFIRSTIRPCSSRPARD